MKCFAHDRHLVVNANSSARNGNCSVELQNSDHRPKENPMKKTHFTVVLLAVSVFLTFSQAHAQKGGSKITNPGAIVMFGYCATAGDNACETANRVRNDLNRPYINGQENIAAVFNEVSGSHDLTVNFNGSSRTITYDFREIAAVGNPQPVWTGTPQKVKPFMNVGGAYNAKLLSGCSTLPNCEFDYVTSMNLGGFTIDRVSYHLQWHPNSKQLYINTPEITSAVNVHYHKGVDGELFTITPLPTATSARYIAGMQTQTFKTPTPSGQYVMNLVMTVKLQ